MTNTIFYLALAQVFLSAGEACSSSPSETRELPVTEKTFPEQGFPNFQQHGSGPLLQPQGSNQYPQNHNGPHGPHGFSNRPFFPHGPNMGRLPPQPVYYPGSIIGIEVKNGPDKMDKNGYLNLEICNIPNDCCRIKDLDDPKNDDFERDALDVFSESTLQSCQNFSIPHLTKFEIQHETKDGQEHSWRGEFIQINLSNWTLIKCDLVPFGKLSKSVIQVEDFCQLMNMPRRVNTQTTLPSFVGPPGPGPVDPGMGPSGPIFPGAGVRPSGPIVSGPGVRPPIKSNSLN